MKTSFISTQNISHSMRYQMTRGEGLVEVEPGDPTLDFTRDGVLADRARGDARYRFGAHDLAFAPQDEPNQLRLPVG